MNYRYEETENRNRKIINPDGDVIGTVEPPFTSAFDERIAEIILDDANFGSQQKDALKAAFGSIKPTDGE